MSPRAKTKRAVRPSFGDGMTSTHALQPIACGNCSGDLEIHCPNHCQDAEIAAKGIPHPPAKPVAPDPVVVAAMVEAQLARWFESPSARATVRRLMQEERPEPVTPARAMPEPARFRGPSAAEPAPAPAAKPAPNRALKSTSGAKSPGAQRPKARGEFNTRQRIWDALADGGLCLKALCEKIDPDHWQEWEGRVSVTLHKLVKDGDLVRRLVDGKKRGASYCRPDVAA